MMCAATVSMHAGREGPEDRDLIDREMQMRSVHGHIPCIAWAPIVISGGRSRTNTMPPHGVRVP